MNDGLCVFLHLDEKQPEENEKLIERIDELLLTVGMKYCGVGNMYIPVTTGIMRYNWTVYRLRWKS